MNLGSRKYAHEGRRHIILAPVSANLRMAAASFADSSTSHEQMLMQMQRLRGGIAVREGALQASQLTSDGRDASHVDHLAWHLLTLDRDGSVGGCVRMLVHPRKTAFESLLLSQSALARCPERGPALRSAVESEIAGAESAGAAVIEIGGWVLTESMRCSAEAVRLALGVWAWGRMIGGAVGIATATVRNHSACILNRIGGSPLKHCGEPIPKYFEPKYGCDIQILRFDSDSYRLRYQPTVDTLCAEFHRSPVLTANAGLAYPLSTLYQVVHTSQPTYAHEALSA